jgi:hypothetical protein
MQEAKKLARRIREALLTSKADGSLEELATQYAHFGNESAKRLDTCATMLQRGSEYQALQLAETEPSLLDLMAELSFAEAPDWVRLCVSHKFPVPSRFDGRAIQALDQLYAKGIGANHPLYKDYRAAVTSRNEVRALQIIRSIARLNPTDANAKTELDRWVNKFFQAKLHDLKKALTHGEEESILHELSEIERLAAPERLAELPEYVRAKEMRVAADRREAMALADRLAASLDEERRVGSWRAIGEQLTRISRLQTQHGFRLSTEQTTVCGEMQRYFESQKVAAAENVRFQDALRVVEGMVNELETRLLTKSTLTLAKSENLYLEFNRRWKEVEQFQKAVPEPLTQRVRTIAVSLHAEINRLQRTQRVKLVAAIAASLAVIGVAQWFAMRAYRVHDYSRQLATLRNNGQVEAAEKMVAQLRTENASLAARPALQGRMDEVGKWAQDQRSKYADAESRLSQLGKLAQSDFSEADLSALGNDFEMADQFVGNLPTGLKSELADRFTVLKNKFEIHLTGVREKLVAAAEEELTALEQIAGSKLGYDQTKEVISEALEQNERRVKTLEGRIHPKLAALELPMEQQTRLGALRKRFDLFSVELAGLKRTNETLLQAKTLPEYRQALEGFKNSQLVEAAEVKDARKLLATFPKPDDVLAGLLVPGDPVGWAAAKSDASGSRFAPTDVISAEISRLVSLRDDNNINDIWEATMVMKKSRRDTGMIYSRGEIVETIAGNVPVWTGSFFAPTPASAEVAFLPRSAVHAATDGTSASLTGIRRTSASQCFLQLELNRLTNSDGTQFERPLLGAFDVLAKDKNAPAVFKAYILQQLATIMNLRPNAWGLQFCPSLRADLATLTRICGDEKIRSQDWMLDRKRDQWKAKLGPFFAELNSRSYLSEARMQREMVRAALNAGLQFGGFVDGAARVHLQGEAGAGVLLWATLADGGKVVRFQPPSVDAKADARFARFSPIYFVPIDRDAVIADLNRRYGGTNAAKGNVPVAPFFNP